MQIGRPAINVTLHCPPASCCTAGNYSASLHVAPRRVRLQQYYSSSLLGCSISVPIDNNPSAFLHVALHRVRPQQYYSSVPLGCSIYVPIDSLLSGRVSALCSTLSSGVPRPDAPASVYPYPGRYSGRVSASCSTLSSSVPRLDAPASVYPYPAR